MGSSEPTRDEEFSRRSDDATCIDSSRLEGTGVGIIVGHPEDVCNLFAPPGSLLCLFHPFHRPVQTYLRRRDHQ